MKLLRHQTFPGTFTIPQRRPHILSKLHQPQSRTFLPGLPSLPSLGPTPVQHLTAHRTLPYPSLPIYNIIAAVPDYQSFLPYCTSSTVTRWSRPDATFGKKMARESGPRDWMGSGRVVEAVGGGARTRLEKGDMKHHTHLDGASGDLPKAGEGTEILTHLLTRWTVSPVDGDKTKASTDVNLDIEFQFANPVYAAMSSAVADRVAEVMIEAFEKRVKTQLEGKS